MKAEDLDIAQSGDKIRVRTFFFPTEFVADLKDNTTEGILKDFNKDSEYCAWTNLEGVQQPHVHISSVELIK